MSGVLHWKIEPPSLGSAPARRESKPRKFIKLDDWIYSLCIAEHNATGNTPIGKTYGRAQTAIDELLQLARDDNEIACAFLVVLVHDCALELNLKKNRALFKNVARKMPHWPVLASQNPALVHNPQQILDELDVGSHAPFFIDKSRKLTTDVFFKYALHLHSELRARKINVALPSTCWLEARKLFLKRFGNAPSKWPKEILVTVPRSSKSSVGRIREYIFRRLRQRLLVISKRYTG